MARNEDSGKGFVFRMLQKVDNLSGVQVGSRLICVDHARYKPPKEAETEEAIGKASKNFSSTVSGYGWWWIEKRFCQCWIWNS